jgi:hypothetical protein
MICSVDKVIRSLFEEAEKIFVAREKTNFHGMILSGKAALGIILDGEGFCQADFKK